MPFMFFSIIIPVYNGGYHFQHCLAALHLSHFTDWELIVVDDQATDDSANMAKIFGAKVIHTKQRLGPAAARNLGATVARGDYLFFTDADCALHPDTLSHIAYHLQTDPDLDALFGSYDDAPGANNFIAQYKNLFHHYVHQQARTEASTFWTGCGAIKRTRFLALRGFDIQRYRRPAIEDIDLGYRLKQAGGKIRLAKEVQVKHLKAWTLFSLLKSDIFDRGIPWTKLLLSRRVFTNDLNLQTHNRVSVVAVYLMIFSLGLLLGGWLLARDSWRVIRGLRVVSNVIVQGLLSTFMLGLALLLLWLNRDLYTFFYRKREFWFVLRVIPMHWLYYAYNGLSFGLGLIGYGWECVRLNNKKK